MFARARLRLALWYTAGLAVILLATGGAAYLILGRELDQEIDDSLHESITSLGSAPPFTLIGTPADGGRPVRRPGEDDRTDRQRDPVGALSSDIFFVVTSANGEVISNPRNIVLTNFPISEIAASAGGGMRIDEFKNDEHRYRVASTEQQLPGQEAGTLIVGRSLDARDHQLRALAIVLGVGGAAGILLAAIGGFWIAGRTLVPIRATLDTQRRFVSDASHELRTPVAVMKANAELVLRHPEQTVEANIDQVAAINEEADHMAKLVGDLLTLARADEQQLALSRVRLDLDDLLDSLVRDMTALAESKGITLSADLQAGEVEADPQRMRQLAAILLDNALKFTAPRGQVKVSARRDRQGAAFTVSDSGPGIPAEEQSLIFERFYRSDKARSAGGTGLGLAIASWIASAHGGKVSVESTPGEGASFTVRLPVHRR